MNRFLHYMFMLLLLANHSCSREAIIEPPVTGADEKSVMLKLAVPFTAPKEPPTRAIGAIQESTIETLDILAFKVEGGVETLIYWSNATKDAGNTEGNATQSFNATLRVKDFPQRFVLITNARTKLESVSFAGMEKEVLLSKLVVDLNGNDRWKVTNANNYTAIPMWGETAPKIVNATTTSISDQPIPMMRMLAKVEVQLDETVSGITNLFKLKSVHVYNTNTSGRIAPKSAAGYVLNNVAQKASLPNSVTSVVGPIAYSDFGTPGVTDIAMRGAIYLFETAAKNAGNFLQETGIVVGGFYGSDTFESYYRVDFLGPDNTTYMDLLRNHKYSCNIIDVKGRGLPTVEEAWRTKSYNMVANILAWDEGVIHNIIFDSQYMLGVSHDVFELDGDMHDNSCTDNIIKIITDHPDGWNATVWGNKAGTLPATWLTVNPVFGAGNAQLKEVHLLTLANQGANRTAYIHIKAGRLTYIVTVVQKAMLPGIITVTPSVKKLPYIISQLYPVYVTCEKFNGDPDPNASWTLTSADPSWLKLSLSSTATFSTASTFVSGTGNQTVYLYALDNISSSDSRRTTIYIGASPLDVVVDVLQFGNPTTIIDNDGGGTPPKDVETYVGAFWRNNETGERIIRIKAGASSANYGTWTATVMWMDGRWGYDDGIMIDQNIVDDISLAGRGISFTTKMNPDAFGTPEHYPVSGYSAGGTVTGADPYIIFRIGLKSTYTPSTSYPVRYAVVLLSYANNTKLQKIFIRQGEEADYLLTNNDPVLSLPSQNGNLAARTVTRKFSPYNLTADILDADPGIRGGRFTDYPSQAGAFFQWANSYTTPSTQYLGIRTALNPYSLTVAGFYTGVPAGYWSTLAATHETCPPGYRRPTDGSITADEKGTSITNSEMRQSLFQKPRAGVNYTADLSNSLKGFYADGFFDRRKLENGGGNLGKNDRSVAAGTKDIAHYGNLFFNTISGSDRYNASLFFPISGIRDPREVGGPLYHAGAMAGYWTSSVYDGTSAMFLRFIEAYMASAIWADAKTNGYSIRCVKEP